MFVPSTREPQEIPVSLTKQLVISLVTNSYA
jgi:hypothetical protein